MTGYKHDYAAFGEHVLRADFMREAMEGYAEKAKAAAEADAPFDADSRDGTHYKDSFRVESRNVGGVHKDRAEALLINDDEAAVFVEFGTKNNPAHHTLTRALDAARD